MKVTGESPFFKSIILTIVCAVCQLATAQENTPNVFHYFVPEITLGNTAPANSQFPERGLHKGLFLSVSTRDLSNTNEWNYRLNYPNTGVLIGISDYGNYDKLGVSLAVMPYVEFYITKRIGIQAGLGAAFFTRKFQPTTNFNNQAVVTNLNWSYRSMFYYDVFTKNNDTYKLGLGYFHQSNSHTRLPNQGYNSFIVSASAELLSRTRIVETAYDKADYTPKNSKYYFFAARFGTGISALTEVFNDRKPVYTVDISVGEVKNNTFKYGIGFYFRYYQHYRNYIDAGEDLIATDFQYLQDNPFFNAATYGVRLQGELLFNHVGFEAQLGANFDKPFYPVDWSLNQGFFFTEDFGEGPVTFRVLGDLDQEYRKKKIVSARIGLKYYVIDTEKKPQHNLYLGAHINANYGQADFGEISVGYVFNFGKK